MHKSTNIQARAIVTTLSLKGVYKYHLQNVRNLGDFVGIANQVLTASRSGRVS
jgi:hypothetical protein